MLAVFLFLVIGTREGSCEEVSGSKKYTERGKHLEYQRGAIRIYGSFLLQ
jgi:hypothetical protein